MRSHLINNPKKNDRFLNKRIDLRFAIVKIVTLYDVIYDEKRSNYRL